MLRCDAHWIAAGIHSQYLILFGVLILSVYPWRQAAAAAESDRVAGLRAAGMAGKATYRLADFNAEHDPLDVQSIDDVVLLWQRGA